MMISKSATRRPTSVQCPLVPVESDSRAQDISSLIFGILSPTDIITSLYQHEAEESLVKQPFPPAHKDKQSSGCMTQISLAGI